MKFFLISDNVDSQMGMRLAGIDGILVHTENEFREALLAAVNNEENGIVLITSILSQKYADFVDEIRNSRSLPIITEIPDRHGTMSTDSLARFVRETIGI